MSSAIHKRFVRRVSTCFDVFLPQIIPAKAGKKLSSPLPFLAGLLIRHALFVGCAAGQTSPDVAPGERENEKRGKKLRREGEENETGKEYGLQEE